MLEAIQNYQQAVKKKFQTGEAGEHAYRPALAGLFDSLADIEAVNEARRSEAGAPDFVFIKDDLKRGYAEAKDLGADLDKSSTQKQIQRYADAFDNVLVTNCLEFRFYRGGEVYLTVEAGELSGGSVTFFPQKTAELAPALQDFLQNQPETITSAKNLAKVMADKGEVLNNIVKNILATDEGSDIHEQFEVFTDVLIEDLSADEFADIYTQTITYGLFAARYNDDSPDDFSRSEAHELLPKANPFLRKFFHHIAGPDFDTRLDWLLDDLIEVFLAADVRSIMHEEYESTAKDPVLHFYETYLAHYDSELRKNRGVYYTPKPVVSFITRAVDDVLQKHFDLPEGLASTDTIEKKVTTQGYDKRTTDHKKRRKTEMHRVQIMDPAAGTGTFLNEAINEIHEKFSGQEGRWGSYVDEHLLERLYGFEIMMAPYTMAHLKLGGTLTETGYEGDERIRVYLTDALEPGEEDTQRLPLAKWLSQESRSASRVKNEAPVMVVMGNPPYNVSSQNNGDWIEDLIAEYKKNLDEKKLNLDDDYIKFIRYGEHYIEQNGEGIFAMITNNSFLDGVTHRRMREHLLDTFDDIYIVNLHGSTKKNETTPDGSKDENVFDIQQGVSINIFVKSEDKQEHADVHYADLWGKREDKFAKLDENTIESMDWQTLDVPDEWFFFTPKDFSDADAYYDGIKLPDLFPLYNSGIQTKRDSVAIQYEKEELEDTVSDFQALTEQEIKDKYDLTDSSGWNVHDAKEDLMSNEFSYEEILYKPFDIRHTVYTNQSGGFIGRPRQKTSKHFVENKNYGLLFPRIIPKDGKVSQFFITDSLIDLHSAAGQTYKAPLYIYPEDDTLFEEGVERKPNLDEDIIGDVADKLNLEFIKDHRDKRADDPDTFTPLDVFDYVYAVLHSPHYREKYEEFLKIDFPRVPFVEDEDLFFALVEKGGQLRKLHLLADISTDDFATTFPKSGSMDVTKYDFKESESDPDVGKAWINDTQYFGNVPKVTWEFYIGGYQVLRKWLYYRKRDEVTLTNEDIVHFQKIIVALEKTDKLMTEIDELTQDF